MRVQAQAGGREALRPVHGGVRQEAGDDGAAPGGHPQFARAGVGGLGEQPPPAGLGPPERQPGAEPVPSAGSGDRAGLREGAGEDGQGADGPAGEREQGAVRVGLADPPGPGAGGAQQGEEAFGGEQRGRYGLGGGHLKCRGGTAQAQECRAVGACDQCHIGVEPGDVAPAVVEREQETAGEARGPVGGAQGGVQLAGPSRRVGVPVAVDPGERRGDDVADALVPVGGQQSGGAQPRAELQAAAVGQAPELDVAPRGGLQVAVAQGLGGVGQHPDLTCRQQSAGQPDSGEGPVVGRM